MCIRDRGNTIADFNQRIKEIAAAYGLQVIDVHNCGMEVYELNHYTSDGTHPVSYTHLDAYKRQLSTYPFPLFFEEWDLPISEVAKAWDNKGDIVIGNDVWIGYELSLIHI